MLAVIGAIDPPSRQTNASKRVFLTRIFLGFRSLYPSFFHAAITPRPLAGLIKTMETIGTIEEAIPIIALVI